MAKCNKKDHPKVQHSTDLEHWDYLFTFEIHYSTPSGHSEQNSVRFWNQEFIDEQMTLVKFSLLTQLNEPLRFYCGKEHHKNLF